MPWSTSDRRSRLPSDWAARRQRVLRRDGYACQHRDSTGRRCLAPANEVDHVERGDNHDERNLASICRTHHAQKTAQEALQGRLEALARAPRHRPTERHPADL